MIKYLVILVIVVIFFGAGKLPQVMGDLGKGIKALKDGLQEDPKKPEAPKEIAKEGDNDKPV